MNRNKNAACMAAVIAVAALGASPSSAENSLRTGTGRATPAAPSAAQMMAVSHDQATAQVAAQVGVDTAKAARLMAAQERLQKLTHGDDAGFVQLVPHYTADGLVVKYLSTSKAEPVEGMRQLRASADVIPQFVTVPFTVDELVAAADRAREALPVGADSTIDLEEGTAVLITAAPVDAATTKSVEAAASPVPVAWQVDQLSEATTGGGGSLGGCTAGFTVRVVGGTEEGLSTAGHCDNYMAYQGIPLNTSGEAFSGNADLQWMDSASFNWSPDVYLGSSPNWPVQHRKNWDNALINDSVCRYGKYTGGCGILLDKWFTPDYVSGGSASFGLMSGTTAIGGDSGGPVYYGNTAWGLHSGHTGSGRNIFTPQDRLSTRLGVQVMIQ